MFKLRQFGLGKDKKADFYNAEIYFYIFWADKLFQNDISHNREK